MGLGMSVDVWRGKVVVCVCMCVCSACLGSSLCLLLCCVFVVFGRGPDWDVFRKRGIGVGWGRGCTRRGGVKGRSPVRDGLGWDYGFWRGIG